MHFSGIFTITLGISLSFGCIFHAHSNLTVISLRQVSSSCFHKTSPISWCFTYLSSTILFYSHWFCYRSPFAICPHSVQSLHFCLSRWLPTIPCTTKNLTVYPLFYCSFLSNFLFWVPEWNIRPFGGLGHIYVWKIIQRYYISSWNLYLSL